MKTCSIQSTFLSSAELLVAIMIIAAGVGCRSTQEPSSSTTLKPESPKLTSTPKQTLPLNPTLNPTPTPDLTKITKVSRAAALENYCTFAKQYFPSARCVIARNAFIAEHEEGSRYDLYNSGYTSFGRELGEWVKQNQRALVALGLNGVGVSGLGLRSWAYLNLRNFHGESDYAYVEGFTPDAPGLNVKAGLATDSPYTRGSRGGCYATGSDGRKVYVSRNLCR